MKYGYIKGFFIKILLKCLEIRLLTAVIFAQKIDTKNPKKILDLTTF